MISTSWQSGPDLVISVASVEGAPRSVLADFGIDERRLRAVVK
jgi:hypothetical protein